MPLNAQAPICHTASPRRVSCTSVRRCHPVDVISNHRLIQSPVSMDELSTPSARSNQKRTCWCEVGEMVGHTPITLVEHLKILAQQPQSSALSFNLFLPPHPTHHDRSVLVSLLSLSLLLTAPLPILPLLLDRQNHRISKLRLAALWSFYR